MNNEALWASAAISLLTIAGTACIKSIARLSARKEMRNV